MAFNPSIPEKVGSNLPFLKNWSRANEDNFVEAMEILREESPLKFAELFLKVQDKIAAPKETKTDININVHSDTRAKLSHLASITDPLRHLESENKRTEYANFEEVSESAEQV